MSEAKGPYRVEQRRLQGRLTQWFIVGPDANETQISTPAMADVVCNRINLAHHHALAAQAERVRQLEEACQEAISTLDQLEASLFAKVAPSHVAYISKEGASKCAGVAANALRAALTPPAKGETQ